MMNLSEPEVSANAFDDEASPSTGMEYAGVLDRMDLSVGTSGGRDAWRSRMDAARSFLEETLSAAVGGDLSVTRRASGSAAWKVLLEMASAGGVSGTRQATAGTVAGAVWFEPRAAGVLLESVLGGLPKNAVAIDRELSELEREFIASPMRKVGAIFFAETPDEIEAEDILPEFDIVPAQQLQQIIDPEAFVLCAEFQLSFGGEVTGSLIVMELDDPSRANGKAQGTDRPRKSTLSPADRKHRLANLGAMVLEFEAKLEGNSIAFADLVNLQVGDVIALESELTQALTGFFNSAGTFEGTIVPSGARKAFRIDRRISVAP